MREIRGFYQKYARDVFRFSLFLSGNHADAQDITSETFVRVITTNSELVAETVKSYLFVVARNVYLELLNKTNREAKPLYPDIESGITLEEAYEHDQTLEKLLAFLHSFEIDDRSALLMRQEGMSYKAIATCLGISENNAKVKVYRLRQLLMRWRSGVGNE